MERFILDQYFDIITPEKNLRDYKQRLVLTDQLVENKEKEKIS